MKLVLAVIAWAALAMAEEMTVKVEKGNVKGVRIDHDFGQYYYSFRGIRYAQAPTGKLRFKVSTFLNSISMMNIGMYLGK